VPYALPGGPRTGLQLLSHFLDDAAAPNPFAVTRGAAGGPGRMARMAGAVAWLEEHLAEAPAVTWDVWVRGVRECADAAAPASERCAVCTVGRVGRAGRTAPVPDVSTGRARPGR
jgi:hypothetical protein